MTKMSPRRAIRRRKSPVLDARKFAITRVNAKQNCPPRQAKKL